MTGNYSPINPRTLRNARLLTSILMMMACLWVGDLAAKGFSSLDLQEPQSAVDLRIDMNFEDFEDFVSIRTQLYWQFAQDGLGAYLVLPFWVAFPDGDENHATLGNLEIGGFKFFELSDLFKLGGRLGLMLPTAGGEKGETITNMLSSFGRQGDLLSAFPDTVAFRFSISPMVDMGILFARADLGLDLAVYTEDKSDLEIFLRFNIGVGAHIGPIDLTAELANYGNLSHDILDETFMHTFATRLSLNLLDWIEPYAALTIPLDDHIDGKLVVITAGITGRF